MAEPLIEELALDLAPALENLGSLDEAFGQIVTNFSTALADALSNASQEQVTVGQDTDASAVVTAVETAVVDATAQPAVIDGDATAVDSAIAGAIDAPQAPVTVDGDATPLAGAIDEATAQPQTVSVDGDTTAAQQAIDGLQDNPITLEVDADTAGAQDAIDGLGASAHGAHSETEGLASSVIGLKVASGLAGGEVGALGEGTELLGAGAVTAGASVAALGAFIGETVKVAADAEAQQRRFNQVFGASAEIVEHINVAGLNISLEELGKTSGTARADLDATAARIGNLGISAGKTQAESAGLASQILAIGATLSVNNPRLGTAAEVSDRLANAFARGGRALAPFGIALTAAQIAQEAFNETGKTSAADLTLVDKITAGTTLTVAKYGDTLGKQFADGADNAQVKLRAFKTQLEETLVAVGTPLLGPVTDSFGALIPVAEQLGKILGDIAGIALPFVSAFATALAPLDGVLSLVGDGLSAIASGVSALPAPVLLAGTALGIFALAATGGAAGIAALGTALDVATGPIGILIGSLAVLGAIVDNFSGDQIKVADSSDAFTKALFGEVKSVDDLSGSIGDLSKNTREFLLSAEAHKDAPAVFDKLQESGRSVQFLQLALQGSKGAFDQYAKSIAAIGTGDIAGVFDRLGINIKKVSDEQLDLLQSSGRITEEQGRQAKAYRDTADQLDGLRKGYEDSLKAQLNFLVAEGDISAAELKNIEASTKNADGTNDYKAALEAATEAAAKHAEAQRQSTLATADQSGALQSVRDGLVTGALAAADAQTQLEGLGLSADDAKAFIKGLNDEVDKFVQTGTAKLPTAVQAADAFQQGVSTAFQTLASDVHSKSGDVAQDYKDLATASDPQRVIENTFKATVAIISFQANLQTLLGEGLTHVVDSLIQQGPQNGALLAQALVGDSTKAHTLERLDTVLQGAQDGYTTFLQQHAGDFTGSTTALADGQTIAFQQHLEFATTVAGKITSANEALTVGVAAGQTLASAGAARVTFAWANGLDLHTPTKEQTDAAAAQLSAAQTPTATAAGKTGTAGATAYGSGLNLPGQTNSALTGAAGVLQQETAVQFQSGLIGVDAGRAFGQGFANGVTNKIPEIRSAAAGAGAAAEQALKSALGISSPSKVGLEIGTNLGEAVATGLNVSLIPVRTNLDTLTSTTLASGSQSTSATSVTLTFTFGDVNVTIPNADPATVRQAATDFTDQVQEQLGGRKLADLALAEAHAG